MSTVLLQSRGVVLVVLLAVGPLVVARLLLGPVTGSRSRRLRVRIRGRVHAPHRVPGVAVHLRRPSGPRRRVAAPRPLEAVAADLRRLDRQFALVGSGAPLVRWRALWAAYDRVLMEAAEQLEVPHVLPETAIGIPRDIERLRVASALEARGLVVRG